MARSNSSSSSEVHEDITQNIKFEADEAKFSLQPYLFENTIKKGSSSSSDSDSQADEGDSDSSADESHLDNLEW
jgi:hypothetical protein